MEETRISKLKCGVAGGLAGAANGFLGTGGGMILVPLLIHWLKLEERQAFATSIAVILPLCAVSAAVYLFRTDFSWATALPYLIGGLIGGMLGGKLFKKVPMGLLRRAMGVLILYGGIRFLL